MTKKHFKAIAEILQRHEPQDEHSKEHNYWEFICKDFGDYFAKENPRFNKFKFYNACWGIK